MTKSGILAAAAVLASMLAGPAMAQQVIYNPGYCAQFYPNANCQNNGPGNPYTGSYQRQVYRDQAYRDRTGRTATTAGTMIAASGPAMSQPALSAARSERRQPSPRAPIAGEDYARRNGFVCIPGTWFRGEDGRMHPCQ